MMSAEEAREIERVDERFRCGDALSDRELFNLRDFYQELYTPLCLLGDAFGLAAAEVMRRMQRLESYAEARKPTKIGED